MAMIYPLIQDELPQIDEFGIIRVLINYRRTGYYRLEGIPGHLSGNSSNRLIVRWLSR